MASVLIVVYSRTGTTRKVAEALRDRLNADIELIEDVTSRSGIFGYLKSGHEAWKKIAPEIKPTRLNPDDYDLVVIGTPVWAGSMASPVRTYLEQYGSRLNRVALFCTEGGSGEEKAFSEITGFCNGEPLATMALTTKKVATNAFSSELESFAETIGKS